MEGPGHQGWAIWKDIEGGSFRDDKDARRSAAANAPNGRGEEMSLETLGRHGDRRCSGLDILCRRGNRAPRGEGEEEMPCGGTAGEGAAGQRRR